MIQRLRAVLGFPQAEAGAALEPGSRPLLSPDEICELAIQARLMGQAARRREIHGHHAGDWPSAILGHGLDFEESRPYSPGDDVRDMDWRTTARLGHPFVKTYHEERLPVLHLVVDRGPTMRFGTRRRLKATQAARLAVLHAFAAAEANLAVAATFWGETDRAFPPRHGRAGLLELIEAAVAPAPPVALGPIACPRDHDCLHRLTAELPRGTRVLLVSDFGWLAGASRTALAELADQCEVFALRVVDVSEQVLPDVGLAPFGDVGGDRVAWLDTSDPTIRKAHQDAFSARRAEIAAQFERIAVPHVEIRTDVDDVVGLLATHG